MSNQTVFISAASVDLRDYRDLLHKLFSRAGFRVLTQDNSLGSAPQGVMELLSDHIRESDCVIHLAGLGYGSDAKNPFPDCPDFECSWTQFEYYFAHSLGKDVIAFVCAPSLSKSEFEEVGSEDERTKKKKLQMDHRDRVASGKFHNTPIASSDRRTSNEKVNDLNELTVALGAAVGTLKGRNPLYEKVKNDLHRISVDSSTAHLKTHELLEKLLESIPNMAETALHEICNLPPSVSHFSGRLELLDKIRDDVKQAGRNSGVVHVLHGLGGIGKTRAAIEYGIRNRSNYTGPRLIVSLGGNAPNRITVLAQLAILLPIKLDLSKASDFEKGQAVKDWLRTHSNWLLIIDRADTEDAVVEASKLAREIATSPLRHVIITSRCTNWGADVISIQLPPLSADESRELLDKRSRKSLPLSDEEKDHQDSIISVLCGFPLALDQAAAFIDFRKISYGNYRDRLQNSRLSVLQWTNRDELEIALSGYTECVASTWLTTFNELSPVAQYILNSMAWLAPSPVLRSWFDDNPAVLSKAREITSDGNLDKFYLEECISELIRYSLVATTTKTENRLEALLAHPLVLEVTYLQSAKSDVNCDIAGILCPIAPKTYGPESWDFWLLNGEHFSKLVSRLADYKDRNASNTLLGFVSGWMLATDSYFRNPVVVHTKIYERHLAEFGEDHPENEVLLGHLAFAYLEEERLNEAVPLIRRLVEIRGSRLGADDSKTIDAKYLLYKALFESKEFDPGLEILMEVLAGKKRLFGESAVDVLILEIDLATAWMRMGRLEESHSLFKKIIGPVLETQSIDVIHKISVLTNLGILHMEKKEFTEAENLLVSSVEICRRFLQEMHPMLSMCLEWLALAFEEQEKLPEAEKAFSEAFEVSKAFRGSKGSENARSHLNRVRAKLRLDLEPERPSFAE